MLRWGGDMEWIDEEKDGEAVRLTVASRGSKAECHPRKMDSNTENLRMLELELENLRLTQLVADLLLKNQKLRTSN
jgi:hypothetical protein